VGTVAGSLLGAELGYGAMTFTLGGVIAFAVALWLSWMLGRVLGIALDYEVFPRVSMPPGVPFALQTFARYSILVLGFMIAVTALGLPLDRLSLLLGALGVGIGFGLQNLVNNFVSGIMLLFERPVRVGDRVELTGLLGEVTSIGIRASRVRTFDGADVIVPNGDLISGQVTNWTLSDMRRRIILPVGVAYGTRPQRVLELLDAVAQENPDVLDDPAPEALFRGFGESSLDFELRVWADTGGVHGWLRVQSDLAVAISAALEQAGIEIPFPQRDLHLKSVQADAGAELRSGGGASPAESDAS
jgi:small-conductance mechanosensitive channel